MEEKKDNNCESCDREVVCSILGNCFLVHELVVELPPFLKNQVKNARSVKQALEIFKMNKLCTSGSKKRRSKTQIPY